MPKAQYFELGRLYVWLLASVLRAPPNVDYSLNRVSSSPEM